DSGWGPNSCVAPPPPCSAGEAEVPSSLPAGQDALHQLLHRGDEAVGVIRILGEAERVVPAEHQVALQCGRVVALVRDALQRLLDAEAARVGALAGAVLGPL